MDEFKATMLDFLKFKHKQQKKKNGRETTWTAKKNGRETAWAAKKKNGKETTCAAKKNGSTPAGYTKRTAWNTKTNGNQITKLEEILLQTQQEQRNLLELINRGQISENKNTFSKIWSGAQ